ncbi:MAG: PspC domain-containing protein [Bryobacteraceae bacterium]
MFCTSCGAELRDEAVFCSQCGRSTTSSPTAATPPTRSRKLFRPLWEKKIAGVCAGLALFFNIDVTLVRIVWVLLVFFAGTGLLAYIILWIVMPKQEAPEPESRQPGPQPGMA